MRRSVVAAPVGLLLLFGLGGTPAPSAPPGPGTRGDRRLWIDENGLNVVVGGSHRRYRMPRGSRVPLSPPTTPATAGTGAVNADFLVPISRLREFEASDVLTRIPPLDLDADGRSEVFITPRDRYIGMPAEIWEHDDGDAPFVLARAYEYPSFVGSPRAVGDLDGDGILEVATAAFIDPPWGAAVFVWKQSPPPGFELTQLFRILGHREYYASPPVDLAIDDLDGDHLREVIFGETAPGTLSIHEHKGESEGVQEVFVHTFKMLLQSMIVVNDLDDDGRREVLVGGVPDSDSRHTGLVLYEADGDDRYRKIWDAGPLDRNIVGFADAGDSDGDGRREFLVGSINVYLTNFRGNCTLYEYDGAGGFRVAWEASSPMVSIFDYLSVASYDLDGDGRRELLCSHRSGPGFLLDVYKSTGDDAYQLLYSSAGEGGQGLGMGNPIGFGDFDRDGRPELVLSAQEGVPIVTKVYETTDVFPTPPPMANFGAWPLAGGSPLSVMLSDLSEGLVETHHWDFGDGVTSDVAAPTHVYQRHGTYSVSLTVSGPGGSDTKTRAGYVRVAPCPAVSLLTAGGVAAPEPKLALIRQFRDGVLAQSATGRALIDSYYRNGPEIDELLSAHASLRWRTTRLLLGALPALTGALLSGVVSMDASTWTAMDSLIGEFQRSGSAALRRDLDALRAVLAEKTTTLPGGAVRLDLRNQATAEGRSTSS
jgi:PKD repeat protein